MAEGRLEIEVEVVVLQILPRDSYCFDCLVDARGADGEHSWWVSTLPG